MPVKVHLRIEIRGHERTQVRAIRAAFAKFLQREQLKDEFGPLRRVLGDDLEMLYAQTVRTITVKEAMPEWASRFRDRLQEIVESANHAPCHVEVRAG